MNVVPLSEDSPLILVVDDDPLIRQILRRVMEQEGYQVVEAVNGKQALEAYKQLNPQLVLLDAMMPVMDGFTCCEHLQQINNLHLNDEMFADTGHLANLARTPVLIITGLDDPESVDRAFGVGATDYLTKPIHIAVLRQRVRRLLQQLQLYQELEAAHRELQRLARTDALTEVANRRWFDEYLKAEWRRMAREKQPLSLILGDIDFFKQYNDTYGHQAGDECLRQIANALRFCAKRSTDLVARYGGEEFAVILPNTTAFGASHVAQRIQIVVNALEIAHANSAVSQHVTLSLGLACMTPAPHTSPPLLIAAADTALYQAKAAGRNTYCPQRSSF